VGMPGNLPHEVSAAYSAGLSAGARAAEPRDGFDVATPGSGSGRVGPTWPLGHSPSAMAVRWKGGMLADT